MMLFTTLLLRQWKRPNRTSPSHGGLCCTSKHHRDSWQLLDTSKETARTQAQLDPVFSARQGLSPGASLRVLGVRSGQATDAEPWDFTCHVVVIDGDRQTVAPTKLFTNMVVPSYKMLYTVTRYVRTQYLQIHRQTDGRTDRPTDRQRGRETERERERDR